MDNQIQNKGTSSLGMHINWEKDAGYPPVPHWIKAGNLMEWKELGVIIWSESANKVICLFPHQALDVLDELRETNIWKATPLCLYWTSYSMPFSEEDRNLWKTTKNRRGHPISCEANSCNFVLSQEQTQELLLLLEQHQSEIRELANIRTKEARKILGRAYTIILGWKRDRQKK